MRRAITVLPPGSWTIQQQTGAVRLAYDDRQAGPKTISSLAGEEILLDLDTPRPLADGEGLALEDGGIFAVIAADEAVADLHTSGAAETARIAQHLEEQQIPMQVLHDGTLRIRHALAAVTLVESLGAHVHPNRAPFKPGSVGEAPVRGHSHCCGGH